MIAEKKGTTNLEEVSILCAHLDSIALQLMSVDGENSNTESFNVHTNQTPAKGADDNATDCAAVMHIAEVLSQYNFNRTIRFCFFDAEEEGYVGSAEYVKSLAGNTEIIKAVVNLDMIGWKKDGKPVVSLVTQTSDAATFEDEQEIRQAFLYTIQNYGVSHVLIPANLDCEKGESNHVSFWNAEIPAIHVIEDWGDYNPYSNQAEDVFANLNLEYYTNVVKAVIGAYANLTGLTK